MRLSFMRIGRSLVQAIGITILLIALLSAGRLVWAAPPRSQPAPISLGSSQSTAQVQVVRPAINLRSGPGMGYVVIGGARQGDQFTLLGRNAAGDWYKIALADGKEAWVAASIVQVEGDLSSIPVVQVEAASSTPAGQSTPAVAAPAATTLPAPAAATGNIRAGEMSGRLLYSLANMEAKRWELWEYNFASAENKKVADWRTELDVSADGKQIAYFAWPPEAGEKTGIWIMDADFSNARLVIRGGAYPSFSPGGDRLVANGGDILYILKTDGSGLRGLTKGEYPAWSPVSNEIVHRACVGGSCGLWIINADSTDAGARRHITTGGSDGQPAWSPDGKRIAFISKEDGNFEIYVIGADGSNKVRLTADPASDGLPVWSPDGRWIAFRSDRDGKWAVYVARPDGSDVRKVVDAAVLPLWFFEKMDWRK